MVIKPTWNNLVLENFDDKSLDFFKSYILTFYEQNKRDFAWRFVDDPYYVVVSEIMLQQTQTARVIAKFEEFIRAFPTIYDLASASVSEVLRVWVGLGYNRRGIALYQIAKSVVANYGGVVPNEPEILRTFKGIGPATAASITAFAYNKPTIFIETNIRTVYLYTFFNKEDNVPDSHLLPLIQATVYHENPRLWYYALMDYGVYLKKKYKNPSRKSKHHAIQSKFEGSLRQVRGACISLLVQNHKLTKNNFMLISGYEEEKVTLALNDLLKENIINLKDDFYQFPA